MRGATRFVHVEILKIFSIKLTIHLQINSLEAVKDSNDMYFRKGQLNVLAHLINMETIVSTNYEEANKTEDD